MQDGVRQQPVPDDHPLAGMRPEFLRHYVALAGYNNGIEAIRHEIEAQPEFGWMPGTVQQWAAIHRLACTELDLLVRIASDSEAGVAEKLWLEQAKDTGVIDELRARTDESAWALDFSAR